MKVKIANQVLSALRLQCIINNDAFLCWSRRELESKISNTTNTVNQDDINTMQLLAKGVLEMYEPPLTTINTHLKELTEKQEAVHNMLTSERRKLEDLQNDAMLDALLADIATNREKLVSISNSMMTLHKRVQSLQTRASNVEKAARNKVAAQSKSPTTSGS